MKTKYIKGNFGVPYEVTWSSSRVWVNHPHGNVARFDARVGIDIHNHPFEQDQNLCADCSSEPDWQRFVEGVQNAFGVAVPQEAQPEVLDAQTNS